MNDEWSPLLRPAPRSASIGLVRVANQAGAAPNSVPVSSASPKAKASTIGDGIVSIGRKVVPAKASGEQEARGRDGHGEADHAAADGEQHAFEQRLR